MSQRFRVRIVFCRVNADRQPLGIDLEQEVEADSATAAFEQWRPTVESVLAALEAGDRELQR